MSNECGNLLIIVGPERSLALFKKDASASLCMDKLVPLKNQGNADEADQVWGCSWICDVEFEFKVFDGGYGCLQYQFTSSYDPPVEFIRRASIIFPLLEFHLQYMDEFGVFAGQVTYSGGQPLKDIRIENEGMDAYLDEYLNRPRPDPWKDGLFENPDSLKPNQSEGDSQ